MKRIMLLGFPNMVRKFLEASTLALTVLGLTGCDKLPPILKEDLVELVCSIPFLCEDKNRVVLNVAEFNYTDYALGDIHVQSTEKSNIRGGGAVLWNKKQKSPVFIKIWWEVIYDRKLWNHGAGYSYSKSKTAAPGTVWCEAIVKLKEPYPAVPQQLDIHIFPDGHVEAAVVESSDPIVSEAEKAKLPRLPAGKYCEKTIDNPWYGVDTSHPGA